MKGSNWRYLAVGIGMIIKAGYPIEANCPTIENVPENIIEYKSTTILKNCGKQEGLCEKLDFSSLLE